jgi:hypothetical protein
MCAQPVPKNVASLVKPPEARPVRDPDGTSVEIITSEAEVVVTEAPDGVAVAAWLLNTDVWSSGDVVSTPENSQMTAPPLVAVGLGVMVNVVAPAVLFLAYQISTMSSDVIADRALPASV